MVPCYCTVASRFQPTENENRIHVLPSTVSTYVHHLHVYLSLSSCLQNIRCIGPPDILETRAERVQNKEMASLAIAIAWFLSNCSYNTLIKILYQLSTYMHSLNYFDDIPMGKIGKKSPVQISYS